MRTTFEQADFDLRCDWGERGLAALAPSSDVVVIVDVLSFSSCVDVAAARGVTILPCRLEPEAAERLAEREGAELARRRGEGRYSLSPASFRDAPRGSRIVLPSPNGAALSLAAGGRPTLAGCLRNATAVAHAASRAGRRIAVVPAGERWPDGSLRPCLEDLAGAGAILERLDGTRSVEARAAVAAFRSVRDDLRRALLESGSGRELVERGYVWDVEIAAELDVSQCAPGLRQGAYVDVAG